MDIIGIICHRAGSQRLPHKAMQLLNGHPMAHYVLQTANQALPKTWLFTNDQALQHFSQSFPHIHLPPFPRPNALSQADTSSEDVIRYLLKQLSRKGPLPTWGLLLQLTSPWLTATHVQLALAYWQQHPQADCMVSVCQPRKPLDWLMSEVSLTPGHTLDSESSPLWLGDGPCVTSKQWLPNGAMYLFNCQAVLQGKPLLHGHILGFDMTSVDHPTDVDVDTATEFCWMNAHI
jgi:CMP-N-acetylneuraminic acid synthetase